MDYLNIWIVAFAIVSAWGNFDEVKGQVLSQIEFGTKINEKKQYKLPTLTDIGNLNALMRLDNIKKSTTKMSIKGEAKNKHNLLEEDDYADSVYSSFPNLRDSSSDSSSLRYGTRLKSKLVNVNSNKQKKVTKSSKHNFNITDTRGAERKIQKLSVPPLTTFKNYLPKTELKDQENLESSKLQPSDTIKTSKFYNHIKNESSLLEKDSSKYDAPVLNSPASYHMSTVYNISNNNGQIYYMISLKQLEEDKSNITENIDSDENRLLSIVENSMSLINKTTDRLPGTESSILKLANSNEFSKNNDNEYNNSVIDNADFEVFNVITGNIFDELDSPIIIPSFEEDNSTQNETDIHEQFITSSSHTFQEYKTITEKDSTENNTLNSSLVLETINTQPGILESIFSFGEGKLSALNSTDELNSTNSVIHGLNTESREEKTEMESSADEDTLNFFAHYSMSSTVAPTNQTSLQFKNKSETTLIESTSYNNTTATTNNSELINLTTTTDHSELNNLGDLTTIVSSTKSDEAFTTMSPEKTVATHLTDKNISLFKSPRIKTIPIKNSLLQLLIRNAINNKLLYKLHNGPIIIRVLNVQNRSLPSTAIPLTNETQNGRINFVTNINRNISGNNSTNSSISAGKLPLEVKQNLKDSSSNFSISLGKQNTEQDFKVPSSNYSIYSEKLSQNIEQDLITTSSNHSISSVILPKDIEQDLNATSSNSTTSSVILPQDIEQDLNTSSWNSTTSLGILPQDNEQDLKATASNSSISSRILPQDTENLKVTLLNSSGMLPQETERDLQATSHSLSDFRNISSKTNNITSPRNINYKENASKLIFNVSKHIPEFAEWNKSSNNFEAKNVFKQESHMIKPLAKQAVSTKRTKSISKKKKSSKKSKFSGAKKAHYNKTENSKLSKIPLKQYNLDAVKQANLVNFQNYEDIKTLLNKYTAPQLLDLTHFKNNTFRNRNNVQDLYTNINESPTPIQPQSFDRIENPGNKLAVSSDSTNEKTLQENNPLDIHNKISYGSNGSINTEKLKVFPENTLKENFQKKKSSNFEISVPRRNVNTEFYDKNAGKTQSHAKIIIKDYKNSVDKNDKHIFVGNNDMVTMDDNVSPHQSINSEIYYIDLFDPRANNYVWNL
ncbi:uncharacterized protein DDB_G0288805-like [Parasteatoda tepidariorum]|uniref:uncharacterized protein DDB_G0288805-like n=1 Tax=Parasteatoda tepidariorum TaxID=114398 RepID=UPI001C7193CB|nr:rho GTPase-activating protein gacU-like [Parasteatoda tepidariorum]